MDDSVFLSDAATAAAQAGVVPTTVPVPVLNDASAWHNFTSWTAQRLSYAFNVTKLAPSLEDLVWAGPRMVKKLGKLGGSYIFYPDAIDGFGQRVIPEATDPAGFLVTTAPDSTTAADAARSILESASSSAAAATGQESAAFASRFTMEGARGLGSVFSYATSKWALACIVMAVVFNRTHIFAATRRRLTLRWTVRLALRLPVILLLAWQVERILESIQCQTSPEFADLRWGNASKSSDLMFSEKNNFLHGMSSTLLFGATDKQSCQAVRMVPWDNGNEQPELVGSLSRLWPLFMTFCVSQFIEVLSATVQGRPVAAETGMTLFEHSLAFAEADAAISNQLGWGLFTGKGNSSQALAGSAVAVTRSMILRRVNTSPEVLLVAFLSAMSHLTSQILGVFNLQSKFRLINTGFWGLCFMGSIVWGAVTFSIEDSSAQALLRFPTVCIIGFVPHVLIICGIFICGLIYALTMGLSAFAAPESALVVGQQQRPTLRDRLARAHANMQANGSLSDIRIRWDMDFYTALLRAGFGAITMASEAVYLNEDHRVNVKHFTWLEDERFREIEELRMQWLGGGVSGPRFDSVGVIGLVPVKEDQANATSGYARERAAQKIPRNSVSARRLRDGVGATERSGRWLLAIEYVMHISRLIITTWMLLIIKLLSYLGIRNPPRWLRALALQPPKPESADSRRRSSRRGDRGSTAVWVDASDPNAIPVPRSERVDVEAEFRRRLQQQPLDSDRPNASEADIDSKLYSWFLNGGWWGNTDTSGDYVPDMDLDDHDFDTTSIISTTETTSLSDFESDGWESDGNVEDGQRTPTQSSPYPNNHNPLHQSWAFDSAITRTRESTPSSSSQVADLPLAASDLARLLNPQSPEERDEAITLAAHLSFEEGIMTRSRFRQHQARQRVKVLLSGAQHRRLYSGFSSKSSGTQMMTPEEEARRLEQILLSRRAAKAPIDSRQEDNTGTGDWATGADGLGSEGPQCVVCQCAPRTIIVWPCRCLSLCDECRVSLAMNNFDKCVCCRREVISFSRIYVP